MPEQSEVKAGWLFNRQAIFSIMGLLFLSAGAWKVDPHTMMICLGAWATAVACTGQICRTILKKD